MTRNKIKHHSVKKKSSSSSRKRESPKVLGDPYCFVYQPELMRKGKKTSEARIATTRFRFIQIISRGSFRNCSF